MINRSVIVLYLELLLQVAGPSSYQVVFVPHVNIYLKNWLPYVRKRGILLLIADALEPPLRHTR